MDQTEAKARSLLASDLPLAEVAEQLGHSSYPVFATWCRRNLGASPRAIREGKPPRRGRGPSEDQATKTWQTRCTPDERAAIVEAVPKLAARWNCSYGAAVAIALMAAESEGVLPPPRARSAGDPPPSAQGGRREKDKKMY